jgi:hypothetical protein
MAIDTSRGSASIRSVLKNVSKANTNFILKDKNIIVRDIVVTMMTFAMVMPSSSLPSWLIESLQMQSPRRSSPGFCYYLSSVLLSMC